MSFVDVVQRGARRSTLAVSQKKRARDLIRGHALFSETDGTVRRAPHRNFPMSSDPQDQRPSTALRARVLAEAAARPSMTRGQGRVVERGTVVASIAVAAVAFESIGGFAPASMRPLPTSFTLASGGAGIAATLSWLVLGRRGSGARAPLVWAVAAVAAPFLLFAWKQVFSGTYVEPFERTGYRCFAYALLIAALPLGSFLVLRRAVEPRAPASLGAAAGAACGAWAGVVIDLSCSLTNARHVLFGHVAPLLTVIVVGAVVGRRTLGAR
jgi:hypothetical protein